MCSRICDKPAPRCWSSSMLPVAHHACTLATGALRSSWTMIVSPFGRIHFCAVIGGKLITDEGSVGAALRLTMLNNRLTQRNFTTGTRFMMVSLAASIRSDQRFVISDRRSTFTCSTEGPSRCQIRRRFRSRRFFRGERFHKNLFKIINILEIFDRILFGFPEHACADQIKDNVSNVLAGVDSPVIEDRHHHRPEFLESVPPHSVEQFRPSHVTHAHAFDFLLLLGREIERVTQKAVGLPLITRIACNNGIESLGKPNLLH